jgi:cation transporter-like permease
MFVEMTGMYKYQLYMQHPTIALIVILSGMILGAGLGSLHSGRIPEDKKEAAIPRYAAVSAAGALLLLVLTPIFAHGLLLWLPLEGLLPVAFVAFAALGFFLGHVVPLSIAAYAADQERLLAWCWAITVTGSVFGTVLASIISRDYGMLLIAMLGIACYLVVTLVAGLGLAFGKKAKKAAA